MRKWILRITKGIALLALALLVGITVIMLRAPAWPDPPAGAAPLEYPPTLRAADITADNGIFYLNRLPEIRSSATNWPALEDIRAWGNQGGATATHSNLLASMAEPREAFGICRDAIACKQWQCETYKSLDAHSPFIIEAIFVSRLAGFDAHRLAEAEDWASAKALLADQIKVGCRMRRGGCLVHFLVARAVNELTLDSIMRLASREEIPTQVLEGWQRMIGEELKALSPLSEAYRYEIFIIDDLVNTYLFGDKLFEDFTLLEPGPLVWLYDVPPVLFAPFGSTRSHAKRQGDISLMWELDRASKPYDPAPNEWELFIEKLQDSMWNQLGRDPLTRVCLATETFLTESPDSMARTERIRLHGGAAALAIRRFEQDEGRLPERLETLVPTYIADLPQDEFLPGSNLIYKVQDGAFQLYSVGPDQVDDGGTWLETPMLQEQTDRIVWPPKPWGLL